MHQQIYVLYKQISFENTSECRGKSKVLLTDCLMEMQLYIQGVLKKGIKELHIKSKYLRRHLALRACFMLQGHQMTGQNINKQTNQSDKHKTVLL